MPPPKRYSKSKITAAAFGIAREQGWSTLSARSIAASLESSTMPIYSNMASMEEIEEAVRRQALDLLLEYQMKDYTDNPFLNLAVGYIVFAREESNLFRFLFIERSQPLTDKNLSDLRSRIQGEAPDYLEQYFGGISSGEMDDVSMKSWIFTHGLAVALGNGLVGPIGDDEIARMLGEAGGAFVAWEGNKRS
jgi:AcrR family transcriptional regulator